MKAKTKLRIIDTEIQHSDIIKCQKQILLVARENTDGQKIRLTLIFNGIVEAEDSELYFMKDKSICNLKLYPLKSPFKNEDKIKVFSEKQKLRKFNTNRPEGC